MLRKEIIHRYPQVIEHSHCPAPIAHHPVVQQPASAEGILATVMPERASEVLMTALGASVANTAMQTGCVSRELSEVEVSTSSSWWGDSRSVKIRFR